MALTEHIAAYLQAQGFPCALCTPLGHAPDRALSVLAGDMRPGGHPDGSRFQIIVRSRRNMDTALPDSMGIIELLHNFSGQLTPDAPHVQRIRLESGAASLGEDASGRTSYSINFRAWHL